MWNNHFKTTLRNLLRYKSYSLNNILGLSLGYTAFIFIYLYTSFENSYDKHIKDHERIYRLTIDKFYEGERTVSGAETYVGCGPSFADKIPEIESYTRTHNTAVRMNGVVSHTKNNGERIAHKLRDFYYADSTFLAFFNYELTKGDEATALNAPNTAVITESLAKIYFGNEDPIGKILIYNDEDLTNDEHVITGVMKDPPASTHLPFRLLLSYSTFDSRRNPANFKSSWRHRKAYTYLKLHPHTSASDVQGKLADVANEFRTLPEESNEIFYLEPLAEVHFIQGRDTEPTPTTARSSLTFLTIISFVVLLIAAINYINLSTSSLLRRTTDIGVKKILGASTKHLLIQQLLESFLVHFLSAWAAIAILILFWQYLSNLAGVNIPLSVLIDPSFLPVLSLLILTLSIISAIIPALVLTGLNPVKALTGKISMKKSKYYRMGLTVWQFALSFALITATLIIYSQLRFMQSQDLGIALDRTFVIRTPGVMPSDNVTEISNTYKRFLSDVAGLSFVQNVAASLTIPGHENVFRTEVEAQANSESGSTLRFNGVGADFVETFDMKILAGRNFIKDNQYDLDSAILLSASAIESLGYKSAGDAIGTFVKIPAFKRTCEIIGVVNDYRLESLKSPIEPTAFLNNDPLYTNFFSLKINESSFSQELVMESWNKHFPGNPMDYFFLEDYFNKQYRQEQQLMNVLASFGILAILLATIGLIGLSIYTLQQKMKEISIRKVLGASVGSIYYNVTINFFQLIILSIAGGIPIAWYFGHIWLKSFPHRIMLSWDLFLLPAVFLLVIAFISVSVQAFYAANTNPVKILRSE